MKERLTIELLTATSAIAWFKYSFLRSPNIGILTTENYSLKVYSQGILFNELLKLK